jgi:predicted nucleic acid-binding protein
LFPKSEWGFSQNNFRNLLLTFAVVGVDSKDCQRAVDFPMGDFEDALVVVSTEKADLNYIITNDKGFLSGTNLSVHPSAPPTSF